MESYDEVSNSSEDPALLQKRPRIESTKSDSQNSSDEDDAWNDPEDKNI
jgi:WD40 repeat protein